MTYSANPTPAGTVTITATYDETVTSVPTIDIDQPGSMDISGAAMTGTAPGTVFTYSYTVHPDDGSAYVDGTAIVGLSAVADVAGNFSTAPSGSLFVIDTIAPATPTVALDLKASSDMGDSDSDDITNTASGNLTFTIPACTSGDNVQMYADGTAVGSLTPCAGAPVDVTVPTGMVSGIFNFTYAVVDSAGNVSGASPSLPVTIDNIDPSDSPATSISDDNGASSTDGITDDTTLMFNGTIGTDATAVEVFLNGSSIGNAVLNLGSSLWSLGYGVVLTDGSYTITTKSTDVAGNVSAFSAPFNVVVDTGAPTIGSISVDTNPIYTGDLTQQVAIGFSDPMDTSMTPVLTANSSTHFTQGTGVWSSGDMIYTVTLTHDGTAEEITAETITLAPGMKDLAGNVDTVGVISLPFAVDTQAPPTPGTPDLVASSDTNVTTDNITSDVTPTLTGTCIGSDTINIYLNGVPIPSGSAPCVGSNYSVTLPGPLSDGTYYAVTARAVDAAGNYSGVSGTFSPLVIDTQSPAVTVEQASGQADPTSASPVLFTITFDEPIDTTTFVVGDITIGGTATVGTSTLVEVAPNDGTTFTLSVLVTADGTVTADIPANMVIDIAGNDNTASVSTDNQVLVDTTAPSAPTISAPVASVNVTGKPTVSGTAEAGALVTVTEGSTTLCTDTADSSGNWSCVVASPLVEGAHSFTATAVDTVGNTSPASTATNVTVVGFSITPNTLVVAENAGTATFDVVLDIQPISTVVITATSTAPGEATAAPATLTFTNTNWNTPQTVTVTGVDDTAYTTDSAAIVVAIDDAASDDAFDAISNQMVTVSLTNDDVAPSGGGGGGYRRVCKDPDATNYQPFGYSKPSMCEYEETEGQVLGVATQQFVTDLTLGSTGDEVTALQNRLTEEGLYTGPITGYFGPLTQAAVIRYQTAHGIVPAVGYFGPLTREEMNTQETSGPTDSQTPEDDTAGIQAQIDRLRAMLDQLLELMKQRSA